MNSKIQANAHRGSSFDDFLREEGIYEEVQASAVDPLVPWMLRAEHELSSKWFSPR